jgi:4a-hydroxytetrahydrobiopterin dehydratase
MNSDLTSKNCEACEGIGEALKINQISNLLTQISSKWEVSTDSKKLKRSYSFKNFYETMAFVNALAWIANIENHHPDLEVGYNYCVVTFTTHAINGLSQNDFICAAKTDNLTS